MKAYRKVDDHYEVRIEGGRLGLVALGAALVLILVFLLGVLVGKGLWGGRRPLAVPLAEVPRADPPPSAGGEGQRRPDLTFYDDLKKPDERGTEAFPLRPEPLPTSQVETTIPARSDSSADNAKVREGVAAVPEEKRREPAMPPAQPQPKREVPKAIFTVQVGSFRDRNAAEDLSARMKSQGLSSQVVVAPVGGRTWYRVHVGLYETRAEAETYYRKKLRPKGIQGFVTTR